MVCSCDNKLATYNSPKCGTWTWLLFIMLKTTVSRSLDWFGITQLLFSQLDFRSATSDQAIRGCSTQLDFVHTAESGLGASLDIRRLCLYETCFLLQITIKVFSKKSNRTGKNKSTSRSKD
jgi:hypothetical protein